ncbi:MAG: manganese efflux pump [Firmicutes bacterium]|nr:manganese efflux pump [Bacillota bacterium]
MELGFLFFFNSILLGIGLAMDAFSVSLADGLSEPKMKNSRMIFISGVYAGFQFLMPMIGWVFVSKAAQTFSVVERFIPWISLGLLGYIGGKMIIEGITQLRSGKVEETDKEARAVRSLGTLLLQGIATSIDALSVGFTIADYHTRAALTASGLIGIVTWAICFFGLMIGKKVGMKYSRQATLAGGIVLVAIGIEIFVKRMFF